MSCKTFVVGAFLTRARNFISKFQSFLVFLQVCDLQGVKYAYEYKLTDPAIHSVNREFGITDMGAMGMEYVLAHHSCNDICRQLGLQNPRKRIPSMPGNFRVACCTQLQIIDL